MLEGEANELKRVFLEGNLYLLVITMIVSVFHSIFNFLAFKNDIQFWNKNKSMDGLSAKSVIVSFSCQLICKVGYYGLSLSYMLRMLYGVKNIITVTVYIHGLRSLH